MDWFHRQTFWKWNVFIGGKKLRWTSIDMQMFTTCNLHTAFTRSAWKSSETRPRELPFHQSTFYNVGRTDPKIELSAFPWQPTSISRPSNQVSITVMTSIAILERFSFPLLHSTNWRVMHRSDIGGRRSNFQFSETADKALPTPSQVKRFPFNRAPPFKSTFFAEMSSWISFKLSAS